MNWFGVLWRGAVIFVAAIGIFVIAMLVVFWVSSPFSRFLQTDQTNLVPTAPNAETQIRYSLARPDALEGTPYLSFPLIRSDPAGRRFGLSSGSSYYDPTDMANVLLVRDDQATGRWLFDGTRQVIWDWKKIRSPASGTNWEAQGNVVAMFMSVVDHDTSGNGKLDDWDRAYLAVVKLDGSQPIRLAEAIDSLRYFGQTANGDIFIVYEAGGATIAATYGLADFALRAKHELPRLGK